MSSYRHPRIPGATLFFTVALEARGAYTLLRGAEALRVAIRRTMAERPFRIEANVILPDHLHMIWTLPEGDCDVPNRWRAIKARFTAALPGEGRARASHLARRERGLWQRRYWEHHVRSAEELAALTRSCWMNPGNMGSWRIRSIGAGRRSTGMGSRGWICRAMVRARCWEGCRGRRSRRNDGAERPVGVGRGCDGAAYVPVLRRCFCGV